MPHLLKLYRKLNQLSIDVAVGAAVCSLFFASVFNIHLRLIPILILVISVWSIYAADHLMDAKSIKLEQLTERRRFYLTHFKTILIVLDGGLILAGTMSLFLYTKVMIGGIILSVVVFVYFILKERMPGLRELFCAAIYSGGVLLAPLLNMNESFTVPGILVVVQFVLTVVLNLLMFSLLDHDDDEAEQQISFARHYGKGCTRKCIIIVSGLQYSLIVFSVLRFHNSIDAVLVILLMNIVLTLLFWFRPVFQKADRFRPIADGIFLLPLLYLLVH